MHPDGFVAFLKTSSSFDSSYALDGQLLYNFRAKEAGLNCLVAIMGDSIFQIMKNEVQVYSPLRLLFANKKGREVSR